jgi:hypothetical protein
VRWEITVAVFLLAPWLAMADQNGAFTDGKSLGASLNQQNRDAITAGNIENKIPAYGQSAAEATYFQGGRGDTVGPGVARVSTCSSVTPDSDPIKRQECEAVNFLARNPDIRPQFSITGSDSMILGARSARANAESAFQSLGIAGGTGSSTQCQTRTETTPAQFTTETCSSPREVGTEQCAMGRIINIDADANYQCDRTATVLSSATRAPSVTTPSCTMGRIVDINSDSNFQCDQTINAYETQSCRKKVNVTVTTGVSGTTGRIVLATIKPGAYLFTDGTNGGVWVHGVNGAELNVGSGSAISGDSIGLDYNSDYGGTKQLVVSHNGCGNGTCSGTFNYQVWRAFNGTWWDVVAGQFGQQIRETSICPKNFSVSEIWVSGYTGSISITASCPDASGAVSLSFSRSVSYCPGDFSGSGWVAPSQSLDASTTGAKGSCAANITYYGNGSFNYNYWSKHDSSSDAHSWKAVGFSIPVQRNALTYSMINNCALLETRAQ